MSLGIKDIKQGDNIQIFFPNGDIYDYEVGVTNCWPINFMSCGRYTRATKLPSAVSRATVSKALKEKVRDFAELRACYGG